MKNSNRKYLKLEGSLKDCDTFHVTKELLPLLLLPLCKWYIFSSTDLNNADLLTSNRCCLLVTHATIVFTMLAGKACQ